jgi:methylamine---glutamate N-methyltransferase subunit C
MKFICTVCKWEYDEQKGYPEGDIPPNTKFDDLPDTFKCPVCFSEKNLFEKIEEEVTDTDHLSSDNQSGNPHNVVSSTIEPELVSIINKAKYGKIELSSMRSLKHSSQLDDILFVPGQLHHKPLRDDEVDVNLKTIIGPKAERPMKIDLPYFVSHMSFGALSKEAKIALAKGSAKIKTAIGSGEGGMLTEEKEASHQYIFEYSTGKFGVTDDVLRQADAIEIKIGQAAKAGLGGHLPGDKVTEEIAQVRGVKPNSSVVSPANHKDINNKKELRDKVAWLRSKSNGIPIGIKLVAGNIELDLDEALYAEPDFITFDCRGGATGTSPTHVKDNFGIPVPFALHRARTYFKTNNIQNISLIVAGGIRTSADIAKCLAMGADCVALGTVAMIGIGCEQYRQCHTGRCPTGVATQDPDLRKKLDIGQSAEMLYNLFKVYQHEIEDYVKIVGKKDVHHLNIDDLVTLNHELAKYAGIKHS